MIIKNKLGIAALVIALFAIVIAIIGICIASANGSSQNDRYADINDSRRNHDLSMVTFENNGVDYITYDPVTYTFKCHPINLANSDVMNVLRRNNGGTGFG
jgi:hypothetical protein